MKYTERQWLRRRGVTALILAVMLAAQDALFLPRLALAESKPVGAQASKRNAAPAGKGRGDAVKRERLPELVEMLITIAAKGADMGPGEGWFHPGQTRYDWKWLARRHGIEPGGSLTRAKFQGPAQLFDRLDRDHDGVLKAGDFDWSERSLFVRQGMQARALFSRLDADSNGRISRAEWDAFFQKAARGKSHLTPEDLRAALATAAAKSPTAVEPTTIVLFRGLLRGELGFFEDGADVGELAPDFTLPTHDGKSKVHLAQWRGKKPVVLVFGSFT